MPKTLACHSCKALYSFCTLAKPWQSHDKRFGFDLGDSHVAANAQGLCAPRYDDFKFVWLSLRGFIQLLCAGKAVAIS